MHPTTFEYLKPTDSQIQAMARVRQAFAELVAKVEADVPPSADRTYTIRKLRECAMWCNVSITRADDGTPRQ